MNKLKILTTVLALSTMPAIGLGAPVWITTVSGQSSSTINIGTAATTPGVVSLELENALNTDGQPVSGWQHALVAGNVTGPGTGGSQAGFWKYGNPVWTAVSPWTSGDLVFQGPVADGPMPGASGGEISVFKSSSGNRGPYTNTIVEKIRVVSNAPLAPGDYLFRMGDSGAGFFMVNNQTANGINFGSSSVFTLHVIHSRTITQWRSVRSHSGIGALPIVLNPSAGGNATVSAGGPNIETRGTSSTGGVGITKIQVVFSDTATAPQLSAIAVTGYTTTYPGGTPTLGSPTPYAPSSVAMANATTMDINFSTALPDQSCFIVTLATNAIAEGLTGDLNVAVRALNGDANLSGTITNSDVLLTKSKFVAGAIVDGGANLANAIYDFNLSGTITNSDVLYCKAQFTAQAYTRSALCP